MTVEDGGSLSGTGTIQGNIVLDDGGRLCPGNSINVHHTTGNITVNSGGTIEIETRALSAGQSVGLAGVDNDVEHVSGRLTFQSGGKILASTDATSTGNYKSGDKYYAIVSEGGIDNLAGATVTDNIAGMTVNNYGVEYATINVSGADVAGSWFWFDLIRGFHATTPNARNVSNNLVALHDVGQLDAVYNALELLDYDQQAAALQSLSGESLATSQSLVIDASMLRTNILLNRIRPGAAAGQASVYSAAGQNSSIYNVSYNNPYESPAWSGWIVGYGAGGALHDHGVTAPASMSVGGTLVGIERDMYESGKVGFYYNYAHVGGGVASYDSYVGTDNHFFGAYLTKRFDDWYWLSTFGVGADDYESRRLISAGTITEAGRADYSGWQSNVYNEIGAEWKSRYLTASPFFGLNYLYLRENGFSENAALAPNAALFGDGADYNALRTHLGSRASGSFSLGKLGGVAEVRAAWIHELLRNTAPIVDARFAAAPSGATFAVNGANLGRDWCWMGTGVSWKWSQNISLYTDYDLLMNIRQTIHTGSGGVMVVW